MREIDGNTVSDMSQRMTFDAPNTYTSYFRLWALPASPNSPDYPSPKIRGSVSYQERLVPVAALDKRPALARHKTVVIRSRPSSSTTRRTLLAMFQLGMTTLLYVTMPFTLGVISR